MDHLLYSAEFDPADFWLFPKLKSVLKGKHFSDTEEIKSSVKKNADRRSCSAFLKLF
jgi:hypothetical protein